MLRYRVDIRRLNQSFMPPVLNKALSGSGTLSKQTPPTAPERPKAEAQNDSVALSISPTLPVEPTLTTPPPVSPVRFEPIAQLTPNAHDASSPSYATGPLVMGMDSEPVYLNEIRVLESRYPGIGDKLKKFEAEAVQNGYCPVSSKALEASVLADPPWPTTSFGSAHQNISNKAQVLQAQNPLMASQNASDYDFKRANEASLNLLGTLDTMFPSDQYPELAMSTRAKTPASLAKKMENQTGRSDDFSLAHLTDTVGARIDAPNLDQMGAVAKAIEQQYKGKIVAKDDYVSKPGANGYRAIHYIVDLGDRMAEIQTSTSNLRAADLATHDTVYKAEFPVSPKAAQELSTAADRIMFLECLTAKGMR